MKKAIILAAGYGKRLRPLTEKCPKPLLKIGNQTLLSNTINFLKQSGVTQIIINVHYLKDRIIEYINKNNFNVDIVIVEEKEKILDTGGGILNAIKYFDQSFICINPDTIWSLNYIDAIKKLEKDFIKNKKKCCMLVVKKNKSLDQSFDGDFNLENNLINRNNKKNLNYIYTGLQIIDPKAFLNIKEKVFSINKIWDQLICSGELYGVESDINFQHVSNLNFYKNLNNNLKSF
tara:strand:- start:101 stop:799 length:699 start_codon:yes stop_codon:yes gene_type:complete